jgi:trimeric autotransporter adhesin
LIKYVVLALTTCSVKAQTHPHSSSWQGGLVQFTAKYTRPDVTFSWKGALEVSLSYYQIEHSADGNEFTTTGIVRGSEKNANDAGYTYIDKSVASQSGFMYYRLKIVNTDGKFIYSPVRMVRLGDDLPGGELDVFPNPVINDATLALPAAWQNLPVSIDLYNANGHLINSLHTTGDNETEALSMSAFMKGIYFVRVSCGKEHAIQKLIKN